MFMDVDVAEGYRGPRLGRCAAVGLDGWEKLDELTEFSKKSYTPPPSPETLKRILFAL